MAITLSSLLKSGILPVNVGGTGTSTSTGTGNLVLSTSPNILTSLTTTSTSFDLLNTAALTVNFAGAATTVNFAGSATSLSIGASTGNTVFNNNVAIQGNLTVNGTTTTVNSIITGANTAFYYDYVVTSTTNARSGTIFAVINGTHSNYTDVGTSDIGNTNDISFSISFIGGSLLLNATTITNAWNVKTSIRSI